MLMRWIGGGILAILAIALPVYLFVQRKPAVPPLTAGEPRTNAQAADATPVPVSKDNPAMASPVPPARTTPTIPASVGKASTPVAKSTINSKLENDFGSGISTFEFGSSTYNVVGQLVGIAPSYRWENLVRATEYSPADVRYFWIPLRSLQQTNVGISLLGKLPDATACFSGQSYVVFLFSSDQFVRLVIRLTPDCPSREKFLDTFANKYGIPFNGNSSVLFQQTAARVTVGGYVSSDGVYSLDVFRNGSPEPAR
jgi:hypothetical protein